MCCFSLFICTHIDLSLFLSIIILLLFIYNIYIFIITILIFKILLYIYILLLNFQFYFIFVNFITVCFFFPILLLTGRYLDKFSELLYLPGFILAYYDEPI